MLKGEMTVFQPRFFTNGRLVTFGGQTFVEAGDELFHLDGNSDPIHRSNKLVGLSLTRHTVAEYLVYFCHFLHGDRGPFKVATVPHVVEEHEDRFVLTAKMIYDGVVYAAAFAVRMDGMVEMLEDEALGLVH